MTLLIDGVKFKLWTPKDEPELEKTIKEHYKDIFDEDSIYFDFKPELRSKARIGSKPDGCVIIFSDKPCCYIVEIELATHPVHEHIVTQISKFNLALKYLETRMKIVDAIYDQIIEDPYKETFVKTKVKGEVHKFLTDLISAKPMVAIVINEKTKELDETLDELPLESKVIEFKTFEREGVGLRVHAHLFEPIISVIRKEEITIKGIEKAPLEIEEELKRVSPQIKEIFSKLRDRIYGLSDKIVEETRLHVVGYRHSPSHIFFASFMLQKKKLKVYLHGKVEDYDDPRKYLELRWRYPEFSMEKMDDLEYTWNLINQAYKKHGLKLRRKSRIHS